MLGTINILQLTLLASLFLTSNVQHLSILTKFLQSVRPCRAAAVLAFCTSFDVLVVLVGLVAGTKQIERACLQPEPFPISTGFFIFFFFFFFFYHDGAEKGTSRNLGTLSDLEKSLICFFFLPLRTTTTTPHSPSAHRNRTPPSRPSTRALSVSFSLVSFLVFLLFEDDDKDDENDKGDEKDDDDKDDDKDNIFLSFFLPRPPVRLSSIPFSHEDDNDDKPALPMKNNLFPPIFPSLPQSRTKTEPAGTRTRKWQGFLHLM
jgi:hypothetical protein